MATNFWTLTLVRVSKASHKWDTPYARDSPIQAGSLLSVVPINNIIANLKRMTITAHKFAASHSEILFHTMHSLLI